jgi:putative transposase
MRVVLCIKQDFSPDSRLVRLMELFRRMVNDCIRIGIEQNKTSMKSLSLATYPYLKRYDEFLGCYRICANSKASGILSNYRRLLRNGRNVRKPYCRKPQLTTCYRIKIKGRTLVLPQGIEVPLNDHALDQIQHKQIRSVTINNRSVSISVLQEKDPDEPIGVLGIALNHETITFADTLDKVGILSMKDAISYKLQCINRKNHFQRDDLRIRERIVDKYHKLRADKTLSEIHKHTSRIIKYAKKRHLAIAVQDNSEREKYRSFKIRLAVWAKGEARRQLLYKGTKNGVLVFTVSSKGASGKECSRCGDRNMFPEENRVLHCLGCALRIERDVNEALLIRKRGLEKLFSMWFKPEGLPKEAMQRIPGETDLTEEVILKADGSHSGRVRKT